jgi:hypothetical protein
MKILLRDFSAKVHRDDIFKSTTGSKNLHKICNGNGVKSSKSCHVQTIIVKSTMFPYPSIHKFIWTSADEGTRNQIDHILIDRRQHSSKLDVWYFGGARCETDHCPVVAKLGRGGQWVNEQRKSLTWRDSVSRGWMRWKVKNSIRLNSQTDS